MTTARYKDPAKRREQIRQYCRQWRIQHPNYQREWLAAHPHYERDRMRRIVAAQIAALTPQEVESNRRADARRLPA